MGQNIGTFVQNTVDSVNSVSQNTLETVKNVSTGAVSETRNLLHFDDLLSYLTWPNILKLITSILAICIFYLCYRIIKSFIEKKACKRCSPHTITFLSKVISYVFYVLITMYVLSFFGINLDAIWGAAGIVGIGVGFAAQTSVSNLISGLFVISEKAMKIGDFISIDDVSGTVDSIGFLAVKIHTLDNQMIRIPNSTIINSNLENKSFFSKRRLVFDISIDYNSDLDKVLSSINEVPALCPTVLDDPAPLVFYDGLAASGISLKLAVWFYNEDYIRTKNDVYINIMKICRKNSISIPFTRFDVSLIDKNS